jgi:hypothetical protein
LATIAEGHVYKRSSGLDAVFSELMLMKVSTTVPGWSLTAASPQTSVTIVPVVFPDVPVEPLTMPVLPAETSPEVSEAEVRVVSTGLLVDEVEALPSPVVVDCEVEVVVEDVASVSVSSGSGAHVPASDAGAWLPYFKPDSHESSGNAQ